MPTRSQNARICSWLICFDHPVRAIGDVELSVDEPASAVALSFAGAGAAASFSDGELGFESCRVTGFCDGFGGAILDNI
jgi:hypothetical protein